MASLFCKEAFLLGGSVFCCLFRGGYDFFEFLKFSLLLLTDDAMMFAFED